MPEATLSVRQLLDLPNSTDLLRAGLPDEELKSIRNATAAMPWKDVETLVGEKLSEALDHVDPIELFATAWEKYSLLTDAAEQSKSGETVLVPMAEHAVTSKIHPYVEILIGPAKHRIDFEVTLSLKLKGLIVRVEKEEIRAIQSGTCEGSVEIAVADGGASVWKHGIKPVPLPGTIKLGAGIRIR